MGTPNNEEQNYNLARGTKMSSPGSISVWLAQMKEGEETAIGQLFKRYWPLLVGLARRKLSGTPRRAEDEEDVAQKVFWNFCESLRAGRLPHLANRQELLALLSHITACQAINQIKHEIGVAKRGAGRVQSEDAIGNASERSHGLDQVPALAMSPEESAILQDSYRRYMQYLPGSLREFAELCLAGYTHHEIALQKGCTERTVDRKLALIMAKWQRLAADSLEGRATQHHG
jgi:DNA-directed RNA polymerase specialized sigma24 family protein